MTCTTWKAVRVHLRRGLIGSGFLGLTGVVLFSAGCVERTVKIDTRPTKAQVVVNDEEVGLSPVKFSFTWYGDYDLVLRKEGYETLKTNFRLDPPWWQLPPFDLITEVFVAKTLRDDRVLEPFELQERQPVEIGELVARAEQLRTQSRYPEGEIVFDEAAEDDPNTPETLEPIGADETEMSEEDAAADDSSMTADKGTEQEVLQPVQE